MGKIIKKEKIKKVFLDDLPRWSGKTNQINWASSIGYKIRFIYDGIEGCLEVISYVSKGQIVTIKYLDKPIFKIQTTRLLDCQLGKLLGLNTNEFKIEMGFIFKDEKRDLTITDREIRTRYKKDGSSCNDKWYKYTCNKCGWTEGWTIESDLLKGNNCTCCSNKIVVEGINDIPTTAPWMIPYFQGGYDEAKLYTCQSNKKVYPICPDCGRVKDKPIAICGIYIKRSMSCFCGDGISYPQKFVFNLLEQLNIGFKTEKTFDWCKFKKYNKPTESSTGKYDYYFTIDDKEYLLETDGEQHSKERHVKSAFTGLKEQRYIDNTKDKLAKENGIEVIRIDCEKSNLEWIKQNLLNSELNRLFDLELINWKQCEEFALSNRVKEACELWNSGINSTKEISKKLNIGSTTACIYLKKGAELHWCSYNSKEESYKGSSKSGKMNGNPVACIETNQTFCSTTECAKQCEKVFGIRITQSGVCDVCRGKSKSAKGLTFKYITDEEYLKFNNNELTAKEIDYIKENIITEDRKKKPVICIENGEIFNSIREVERKSEEVFGEKFYFTYVIQVCKGRLNQYKGYHFKYVSDLPIEQQSEIAI